MGILFVCYYTEECVNEEEGKNMAMRQLKIAAKITNRDNAIDKYLSDISRTETISPEREAALARQIHKGGEEAEKSKKELIEANLRFVVSVAKQYLGNGLSLADLVDEGNIGLIKAAERYDETKGFKFISYAVWWIRQSIIAAIGQQGRMIRLPMNKADALNRISKAKEAFMQANDRKPSEQELEASTGIDYDDIKNSLIADKHEVSIDQPIGDEDSNSLSDMLSGSNEYSPDHHVDMESMKEDIIQVMNSNLSGRERKIVSESFGLCGPEKGLDEIGMEMGLSRERVRQIRQKSLRKMRKRNGQRILAKYLG